jgi:hypothetical protein
MFGRRRHVAPAPVVPAPRLSDQQVFELVQGRLDALIGPAGGWSLSRRKDADTDSIFQGVLVTSVAADITRGLAEARLALETDADAAATDAAAAATAGRPAEPGQHVATGAGAPDPLAVAAQSELAAFGWEPAPITVWADLRKPVTAEIPQLHAAAATR